MNGNLCCNACSLYWKLHNVVRPAALAGRKQVRRSKVKPSKVDETVSLDSTPNTSPKRQETLELQTQPQPHPITDTTTPGVVTIASPRWSTTSTRRMSPFSNVRDDEPVMKRARREESFERGSLD